MNANFRKLRCCQDIEKKRQSEDMIEMRVTKQNIERISLDQRTGTEEPGSGIEHQ